MSHKTDLKNIADAMSCVMVFQVKYTYENSSSQSHYLPSIE